MTMPRCVVPGTTYLITRRCVQRQFLLTPSKVVNDCLMFCLACAADKYKIEVHAATYLSNHFHLVITDTEGRLPEFMGWLVKQSAKCINVYRGRGGTLFEPESYSGAELREGDDVLDKMVYTLVNPVQAGLVRRGHEWPGFRSRPQDIGAGERVLKRPDVLKTTQQPGTGLKGTGLKHG